MITKDKLWKAIFEDFFQDAILFFFPDAYSKIDWKKGFEFLDKELQQIYPDSESMERRVDLLVKVWLLDGQECWFLIHIEVQGYKDLDFPRRMFAYFYRLFDKFERHVLSFALLTDPQKDWRPACFESDWFGTKIRFDYPIYKLADHNAANFDNDPNPWALVMKAALLGLKGNWSDEALLQAKLELYRELRARGYTRKRVNGLFKFIKYYVKFDNSKFLGKFDDEIQIVNNIKRNKMGMKELEIEHHLEEAVAMKEDIGQVLDRGVKIGLMEGLWEGLEKGLEKGKLKKDIIAIRNMLKKKFPVLEIANLLEIAPEVVLDFQKQLKKEPKITEALKAEKPETAGIAKKLKVSPLLVEVIQESLKKSK